MASATKNSESFCLRGIIGVLLFIICLLLFFLFSASSMKLKKPHLVTEITWDNKVDSEAEIANSGIETLEDSLEKMIKIIQERSKEAAPQQPTRSEREHALPDQQAPHMPSHTGISKLTINLKNPKNSMKTADNTIPVGTVAKAVLLSSSTSTQVPNDFKTVLLRIIDTSMLPRKFHSDSKECYAVGIGYEDTLSERLYIRLEKLYCMERQTGEFVEIPMQGYVKGEDGQVGVRGVVVDKARENMGNDAMIGEFFDSMGQFITQLTPFHVGGTRALERYKNFCSKRAEQLQPILQVASGREVNIFFTQMATIDRLYSAPTNNRVNAQVTYSHEGTTGSPKVNEDGH